MADPTRACPVDGTTLVKKTETFVTIDECPKCKGSFYERNEAQTSVAAGADVQLLVQRGVAKLMPESDGRACPGCGSAFRAVEIAAFQGGFEIDSCGKCGGLWLDGGEAEKLGRVARETESARQSLTRAEDMERKEHGKGGWRMVLDLFGIEVAETQRREPGT